MWLIGGILRHLVAVSNFEFSTENPPDNLGPNSRSQRSISSVRSIYGVTF
jgi:hypothetical protein